MKHVPSRTIPIAKIVADDDNPNHMTARQLDALDRTIDKYGFAQEPWVRANKDGTYTVIDGEHRVEVLRRRKQKQVRCRIFELPAQADLRILRQVANKLHGTHDAQKDADEFKRIFEERRLSDLADLLGRDEEQFQAVLEKRYDLRFDRPEMPPTVRATTVRPSKKSDGKEGKTKIAKAGGGGGGAPADTMKEPALPPLREVRPGDVWRLGGRNGRLPHYLLCGDCTIRQDVLDLVARFGPHQGVAQIATDPPYGVGYSRNRAIHAVDDVMRLGRSADIPVGTIANDEASATAIRPLLSAMLRAAPLLSVNTLYVFGMLSRMAEVLGAFADAGCSVSGGLAWVKQRPVMNRQDYNTRHEDIVYGWKGRHRFFGSPGAEDVLFFDAPMKSPDHPTSKPVELMARLVRDGSKKGAIVYDPFAGSGSTLIACANAGRRCMAVELEPKYCSVILRRYEAHIPEGGVELVHRAGEAGKPGKTKTKKAPAAPGRREQPSRSVMRRPRTPRAASSHGKGRRGANPRKRRL